MKERKMKEHRFSCLCLHLWAKWVLILFYLISTAGGMSAFAQEDNAGESRFSLSHYERLVKTADEKGFARVIIKLKVRNIQELTEASTQYGTVAPGRKFPFAGIQADLDLEDAIQTVSYSVLHQLNGRDYRLNHTYRTLPYLALEVSPEALAVLSSLPEVLDIFEDKPSKIADHPASTSNGVDKPMLDTSVSLIGADVAWSMGYTGNGWYVAILDSGIRRTHQFFQGKNIVEACYSLRSDCPNGSTSMEGPGAAAHYESTYEGYDHGSHVAGIAAGNSGSLAGVAKRSNIIAVQVFSRFSAEECDGSPCVLSYRSDQISGLEHVYSLRTSYSIAAVNMSLGGDAYDSNCNSDPRKEAIDNLKSVRIATVISAGNESLCGSVGSPACISSAVSVGASDNSDNAASFTNWHPTMVELMAPGVSINSATGSSDSSYGSKSGTSMAAPHVTGAWALLRQASSTSSVDTILSTLRNTGVPISSQVCAGGPIPRIQVDDAIQALIPSLPGSITVTSPNGGENWVGGSFHAITWTSSGSVGTVKIEYTTDNGGSWSTVTASHGNTGTYSWRVAYTPSSLCKVRIQDAVDGKPSDTSDSTFSIEAPPPPSPRFIITSPNGGEHWKAGSSHNITWTSTGSISHVKIKYSTNNGASWFTVISSTGNDGNYSWTLPDVDSSSCLVKISEPETGSPSDTSNAVFTIFKTDPPKISLNRTHLNFCTAGSGTATGEQELWINNSGGQTLDWNVGVSGSWLYCNPLSGSNAGVLKVGVDPRGLTAGNYSGSITITDPNAVNSPRTIAVKLLVKSGAGDQLPFGDFATPVNGSTVSNSIAVTGWALDDVEIKSVKIYRTVGSASVLGFVGEAARVEGARPDVESAFPNYPKNYLAGWGYMMLTNSLPDGSCVLYAVVTDSAGNEVTLGSRSITIDNANAVKPFGAIDAPPQGGTASGNNFRNRGWVLTPPPNKIPENGSTIHVYVDGKHLGSASYNVYRADIANMFPGYANSNGALAYFDFDTTVYTNGVHTIYWTAADNAGNTDGIGSRYFTVKNTGESRQQSAERIEQNAWRTAYNAPVNGSAKTPSKIPMDSARLIRFKKGFNKNRELRAVYPDDKGMINIDIRELERIEIHLTLQNKPSYRYAGYLVSKNTLKPLPIGSTLDAARGIFYWSPGPGFLGEYELVFVDRSSDRPRRIDVKIKILPKYQ